MPHARHSQHFRPVTRNQSNQLGWGRALYTGGKAFLKKSLKSYATKKAVNALANMHQGGSRPHKPRKTIPTTRTLKKEQVGADAAYGFRAPAVVIKKNKRAVIKKSGSKVIVTKALRDKIKKVASEVGKIRGTFTNIKLGVALTIGSTNQQIVIDGICGHSNGVSFSDARGLGTIPTAWCFNPEFFLNAAAVLFNGKGQSETVAGNDPTSANWPLAQNVKFKIVKSYAKFVIKNTCGRAVAMRIYDCRPKYQGAYNYSYTLTSGNSTQSSDIDKFDALNITDPLPNPGTTAPVLVWSSLNTMGASGIGAAFCPPSITWFRALNSEKQTGTNLNSVSVNELFLNPKHCHEFNKSFSCDEKIIVLEAGESYEYHIEGPGNYDFDNAKHFKNNVFFGVQKYMVCPMLVVHNDLVRGATSGVSHATDPLVSLAVDRSDHCIIQMPEQAGFQFPTVASVADISLKSQQLTFRRPVYYYKAALAGAGIVGAVGGTESVAYGAVGQ